MSSGEWMTLHKAVLRLTLKGMEEAAALHGLSMAMHHGEIASREVRPGSSRAYEATEMTEVRSADVESWENRLLGVKGKSSGGRPPVYDWQGFDREIIRIANQPDGLPPKQVTLINTMRDWAETNWGKSPDDGMLKMHISAIYADLKKG